MTNASKGGGKKLYNLTNRTTSLGLASGTKIEPFEILSAVGAGGMGEVYRARDTRLGRDVAIKVLPECLTSDPERLRRFEQEARATAALNHPNILAVYQMGTHEGVSYLVEELLYGETLRERLRRGPVLLRKAIEYGVQIANGLAAAHDKGIVHRDLKPENLFVTKDGRVKILDFGLAKLVPSKDLSGEEKTVTQPTEPGTVMGTVGYMSPEQVRGKNADHRSDIFALGTILYEMVTGKQTFRKPTSAETMTAILNEEPPSISQITPAAPPGMQRVVHRCLEKDPEQRFHSAHDLAFALQALSDSAITTPSGSHARESGSFSSRRVVIAGVAIAILVGAAVLAYSLLRPEPAPRLSNFVQLTHDGQPKSLGAIDGSRLYLSVSAPDYQGMAEMSAEGGEWKKLPILPSANMVPLELSPAKSEFLVKDGHGVPATGPLWTIPALGGSPRRLGDIEAQNAAWSPDGKWLAYSNQRDLFISKADGAEPGKILTAWNFVRSLVWSPDGYSLRFDVFRYGGLSELWEVSSDGRNPHPLLSGWHNPPNECCGRWTADGKYFLFLSNGQIFSLPRRPGFLRPAAKPVQLTSSPTPLDPPVQSADGKKLFVVGLTRRGELSRYDSKTGQFSRFLGGMSAEYVALSHDAQSVAYVSYPEGTLWRMKRDGSERVQLTYPPAQAMLPRWSPDDKTIAFFTMSTNQQARMYKVSADGVTPQLLLPNDTSPQVDPTWSPDRNKILFGGLANDPQSAIRVLDLSTNQISVVPGSQGLYSPRWSPDTRYIVAISGDSKRLLSFDATTGKWTDLVTLGNPGWPSWSKDGKYVYFIDGSGAGAVVRIRISDRKSEQVLDLKTFNTAGFYGSWLGLDEDDSLILLRDTGSYDIYSLDWEEP